MAEQDENNYLRIDKDTAKEIAIRQAFNEVNASGLSPFKRDIPDIADPENILDDPGIKAMLAEKNTIVFSNDEIRSLLENPAFETIADIRKRDEARETITPEQIRQVKEASESIMADIKEKMPQLYAGIRQNLIENREKITTDMESAKQNKPPVSLERDAINAYYVAQVVRKLVLENSALALNPTRYTEGEGAEQKTYDYPKAGRYIILPSKEEGASMMVKKAEESIGVPLKPPPGTPAQQSAVVIAHEIEHAVGDQTECARTYFEGFVNKLKDRIVDDKDMSYEKDYIVYNLMNAKEMDSSFAPPQAFPENFPPEIFEYIAAIDIVTRHETMMDDRNYRDNIQVAYTSTHNAVGFATMEAVRTGQNPDYYTLISAVNGFYAKTGAAFDKMKGELEPDQRQGVEPTIPVTLDVVKKSLATGYIYNAEEAVIAMDFIKGTEESLGIQPQDPRVAVKVDMDSQMPAPQGGEPRPPGMRQ